MKQRDHNWIKYIVRITIWGQWYDSIPMTLEQAEMAYKQATENKSLVVSIIEIIDRQTTIKTKLVGD